MRGQEKQPNPFRAFRSLPSVPLFDLVAVVIASGFGLGFIPFAPGTFGSLLGVAICYGLIQAFKFEPILLLNSILAASVVTALLGVWASTRAESIFNRKDASQIVIDEVCGQLISFVFLAPILTQFGGIWRQALVIGFGLFRLFDIFKPWPIRKLEHLGSGLGVMADDVLAGIYSAVVLALVLSFLPF